MSEGDFVDDDGIPDDPHDAAAKEIKRRIADNNHAARIILETRQRAYSEVFRVEDMLSKVILEDLAKFCRANESTHAEGKRNAARLDGRREVWLRIQDFAKLSVDELMLKYHGSK